MYFKNSNMYNTINNLVKSSMHPNLILFKSLHHHHYYNTSHIKLANYAKAQAKQHSNETNFGWCSNEK